jgi:hypothetical protein
MGTIVPRKEPYPTIPEDGEGEADLNLQSRRWP